MSEAKNKESKRIIYLDILKIIACFFVIVNHSQSSIFTSIQTESILYLSVFYFFASKVAVPIFVMVTGSLLIPREISLKDLFKKTIFKIVLVIIIFSFVIFVLNTRTLNLFMFFKNVLSKPVDISYWYLYMLIGIYLMSPFLKKMVDKISNEHYILLFVLWIVFIGIIPILRYNFGIYILQFLEIPILGGYVGYYIFGDYLNKTTGKLSNKIVIPISAIMFLLSTAAVTFLTINEFKLNGEFLYGYDNVTYIFFIITSLTFFIIIKRIFENVNFSEKIEKILAHISRCTFGIYLIHTMVMNFLLPKLKIILLFNLGNLIGILIFQMAVFLVSLLIVNILIKIPFIKKLI